MHTLLHAPPLRRLQSFLGVEPGEEARVWGVTGLYAVLIMGCVFIETIALALFLTEFGPQLLPYSYISSAALASLSALGFLKLTQRVSFQAAQLLNIAFLIVGCLLLWFALVSPGARWAIFLLPTWLQVQLNLVNLVVWPLAGRLFDVRQAKRLLGLVGAGNWLANMVGGFIVARLIGWFGTSQMMLMAAVMTALGLWMLRGLMRAQLPAAAAPPPPTRVSPAQRGRPEVRQQPRPADRLTQGYTWLILVYVVIWWTAFIYLDNIFFDRAAAQFAEPAQMAQAMGLLLSAMGVVALITTLFGTGVVLRRFGLRAAFLAMPVVCVILMGGLAVAGSLGQGGALLFWLAALGKLFNVAWGFSLSQTALVLSYQPIPDARRDQVQTLIEGIVQPLAIGVAGISLLGLNTLLGLRAVGLAWVFAGLAVLLIVVIVLIDRQYPRALSQVIARRQWGGSGSAPLDQTALALFRASLRDPYPAAVIYSMDTLEQADRALLAQALPELLQHPAPEVRKAALGRIEQGRLGSLGPAVQALLAREDAPEVAAAALQSLAALDLPTQERLLAERLADPDRVIQRGALVGLFRYGSGDQRVRAEDRLQQLVESLLPAERVLAAEVLAEVGDASLWRPALQLLQDPQTTVLRAALKATAVLRDPHLWPAVVQASAVQGARHQAVRALAAGGVEVLPILKAALDAPRLPDAQVRALASACGRIGGEAVAPLLLSKLSYPSNDVRTAILEALSAAGYRAAAPEAVQTQIQAEAAQAAWMSATLVDIGDADATLLVRTGLETAIRKASDRICLLLSFCYDGPAILRARATLACGQGPHYAYALEILDTQLPTQLKSIVLPIVEELAPRERLARLAPAFPQPSTSVATRLQALIEGTTNGTVSVWARACALHAAGSLPAPECLPAARTAMSDPDRLVQEAARWGVAQLDAAAPEGDRKMLSVVEKVIILKTVDLFRRMPDDVLADVAALLEEVDVGGGEIIFEKGEPGDSMYIVVAGRLRVDDGERLLNHLEERAVFGEMALLDSEPRVASVKAVDPTRLLRLHKEPFFELIVDRPELAIGLIHVLTGHLRARVRDVTQLSAQVKELRSAGTTGVSDRETPRTDGTYAQQPS